MSRRPSRRVIELEKRLLEDREYLHPRDLPVEFIEEVVTLSDEDAMKLAARLFMMDQRARFIHHQLSIH